MKKDNVAIVTIIYTEDFLPFAECWYYNLTQRYKTQFDVKVLVTDNVNVSNYKFSTDMPYTTISYSAFNSVQNKEAGLYSTEYNAYYYRGTVNKLYTLLMSEYDYVVFIDADMYIYENLDDFITELIDKYRDKPFIGGWRITYGDLKRQRPTVRVEGEFFIIKPNQERFNLMQQKFMTQVDDETVLALLYINQMSKTMSDDVNEFFTKASHDVGLFKLLRQKPEMLQVLLDSNNEDYHQHILDWYSQKKKYYDEYEESCKNQLKMQK